MSGLEVESRFMRSLRFKSKWCNSTCRYTVIHRNKGLETTSRWAEFASIDEHDKQC